MYISILAVFGTSLAVVIFNQLVKSSTAIFASSVTYLIPIVAIFWGVFGTAINHDYAVIYLLVGILINLAHLVHGPSYKPRGNMSPT